MEWNGIVFFLFFLFLFYAGCFPPRYVVWYGMICKCLFMIRAWSIGEGMGGLRRGVVVNDGCDD